MQVQQPAVTFCGLPFAGLDAVPNDAIAAIIGAGYALGTPKSGAENAPFFLRTVSKSYTWSARNPAIVDMISGGAALGQIVDLGDIDFGSQALSDALKTLEAMVSTLPSSVIPCTIGGDHTVTLAAVKALSARRTRPFSVVQFDHHLDLQIWDGAPGCPGDCRETIFNTNVMSHVVDQIGPRNLIQIGMPSFLTVEAESSDAIVPFLQHAGRQICLLSSEIEDVNSLRGVVGSGQDIYLSVDVDVLDSDAMSSTGYPSEVGLRPRELLRLIDAVLEGNTLIGCDLVEFAAPRTARDPKTLADAARAALIFLHLLNFASRQTASGPAFPKGNVR